MKILRVEMDQPQRCFILSKDYDTLYSVLFEVDLTQSYPLTPTA